MKIVVSEFRQESNSLSPVLSDLEFWESGWILSPNKVHDRLAAEECAIAGMIEVLEGSDSAPAIVYGPAFYAQSGGTAEQEVMERYLDELLPVIHANLPVDGVFLSFHGALQTTEFDDAEAEVARRVRAVVGQDCVIAASSDLHGYISRSLVEHVDILCGYQTYPHVDFVETGRRAARLGLARISATTPPVMAWAPVPMMVSASAYNTLGGPFSELMDHGRHLVDTGAIVDFTIYQMQPWLDVSEPNSTVIVLADDEETARRHAEDLANKLYSLRGDFVPRLSSIDEIIARAADADSTKPVLLVDSADSSNAGAPGDSMAVAERFLAAPPRARAATVVADPAAASRAHDLGVGATAHFTIGGSVDRRAPQLSASGYVRSLHDGDFRVEVVGSSGTTSQIGRSAVIRFGNLDVLVCETIVSPGDPQLYRAFGIEPLMYDLVVIKANTSFRVGYKAIAGEIYEADTPGAAAPKVERLPFTKVPKTLYPWADGPFTACAHIMRPVTR